MLYSRLTVKLLYATIALYTNNKGVTIMYNNPFIHARSASDWVIGLLIATHSAILTSLFLILASRAFN